MKQCYFTIFCWFFLHMICASSTLAQKQEKKNYPILAAVYILDSSSIELNHTLFEINGGLDQQQADTIQSFGAVLFPHDNLRIDYNHSKWRMNYSPAFGNPYGEEKKGSVNFLNKFEKNSFFSFSHDDIGLKIYLKDTLWIDTLPKSKEIVIVVFGTNASEKLVQLLDTVNALVVKKEYAKALECMKPLTDCCTPDQYHRFMPYYRQWIVAREQESRNTNTPKRNKGRKSKTH